MVVAYVRVSSRSQSTETQRDAIQRVAKARGERITQWFEETRSGKTIERPALESLRQLVRQGGARVVYVYRLDRLTRSGVRDMFAIIEEFRARKVAIVTVADGFSLDSPGSDVVLAVLAWAAQMERQAIGERISDAHARIKRKGGRWGRPRTVSTKDQERIRSRRAKGESIRAIATALKISRAAVSRVVVSQKPTSKHRSKTASKPKGKGGPSR